MRALLPVIRALRDADVSFVVVGGVAVMLQGHPRSTVDLDLVIDLEADNVGRAMDVLTGLGLTPRVPVDAEDFADPAVRADWIQHRNLTVFSLRDPDDPRREVHVFAQEPMPFDHLRAQARLVQVEDVEVPVASRQDLIELKRAAGRPQDIADIEALEALDRAEEPTVGDSDWDGGWAADRARKRRAWLALTPAQRLEWLEDMLDLAAEVGALDADRARRAEEARRAWEQAAPA